VTPPENGPTFRPHVKESAGTSSPLVLIPLGLLTLVLVAWVGLLVWDSVFSRWQPNSEVTDLVTRVRADIDAINREDSEWKISEADLEINIAVTVKDEGKVEVQAVGEGTTSSTRESGHKLVLKIRRQPAPPPVAAAAAPTTSMPAAGASAQVAPASARSNTRRR